MSEITTLRKLLDNHGFDWNRGVIVVLGKKTENVYMSQHSPALNLEFDLEVQDLNRKVPIFTAEDPEAMYLLCYKPDAMVEFHKVPLTNLEGLALKGIQGYPQGPEQEGVSLTFLENPLDVCVTQGAYSPAMAGCPEIHFYCTAEDRKTAMDLFTSRMLTGYLLVEKSKEGSLEEHGGYMGLLERLFHRGGLGVQKKVLPPRSSGEGESR